MTEQHGDEPSLATEAAGMALGPVLDDGLLELEMRGHLQHLAENAGYSYHGGGGPPYDLCLLNTNRGRLLPSPLKT
jgi:hypothetical protein